MLITNAKVISWQTPNLIIEDQSILIRDGGIREIGPAIELSEKYAAEFILDAGGQYVMPGNICAHTHFYGAFARGMAIPGSPPADFVSILEKIWWSLDQALDAAAVRLSAQVCLLDAIRHGTTTLIDHHASPNVIEGSLDIIAEAVDHSGLRAVLSYEVTDRNGLSGAQAGISENLRFLSRVEREAFAEGRIKGTFGLHASLTLSDETLENCRKAAPDGAGFHIHIAEGEADQLDSLKKSGLRVVERLDRFGILGAESICAHAIHVDQNEVDLLAQSGTWVTHQPRSNMNNAVGIGDVEAMLRNGVKVCLGNDGFSNTMWEEWKTTYLVHKVIKRDPRVMPADRVIQMGVYNNAALVNLFFPRQKIGSIVPGATADLIFVDYHPYTPMTVENLPWHILFGFHESMVTTTIVNGRVLMLDRKILTMDADAITREALDRAPEIWERYKFYVPA